MRLRVRPAVLLTLFWSAPLFGQERPLPPLGGAPLQSDLATPYTQSSTGVWPLDAVYGLSVKRFGLSRTKQWLEKGILSLQKTAYRKYYIEQGFFLMPTDPGDSRPPVYFIPLDPGADPLVIFMKDYDRFQGSARGLLEAIRESVKSGDTDLVQRAGDSLFDSKYTQKLWALDLSEKSLGDGHYFYKLRLRRGRLDAEGGVGGAVPVGRSTFVGGALSVENDGGLYRTRLADKAKVGAKLGVWGKVPGTSGTSWGLSAVESWLYDTRSEEGSALQTEFRAGLFHSRGATSFGGFVYRATVGPNPLSPSSSVTGGQLAIQPSGDAVSLFLSYDRTQTRGAEAEDRFLAGVDLALKRQSQDLPGEVEAAAYLGRLPTWTHQALVEALRRKALAPQACELLEVARAEEKRLFFLAPPDRQEVPGWSLTEVGPNRGEPETLGLLIAASSLRRAVDEQVQQSLLLLAAVSKKRSLGMEKTLARASSWVKQDFDVEGENLSRRLTAYGQGLLQELAAAPGWPKGLVVEVHGDDWPPLLAGYGESFLVASMGPAVAKAWQGVPTRFRLAALPVPGRPRIHMRTSEVVLELPRPEPGAERQRLLKDTLDRLGQALAGR